MSILSFYVYRILNISQFVKDIKDKDCFIHHFNDPKIKIYFDLKEEIKNSIQKDIKDFDDNYKIISEFCLKIKNIYLENYFDSYINIIVSKLIGLCKNIEKISFASFGNNINGISTLTPKCKIVQILHYDRIYFTDLVFEHVQKVLINDIDKDIVRKDDMRRIFPNAEINYQSYSVLSNTVF